MKLDFEIAEVHKWTFYPSQNIVAFGAGLIDGLYGDKAGNTKAAVIRLGFME